MAAGDLSPEAAAKKRETSRISLEPLRPGPGVTASIRDPMAAMQPPSTIKISRPGQTAQINIGLPMADETEIIKKKTTSRISLESAIGPRTSEVAESGGPKTIRLKRPGESVAPRVAVATDAATIRIRRGEGGAARNDVPDVSTDGGEPAVDGASATQRRTVVLRRPTGAAGAEVAGGERRLTAGGSAVGQGPRVTPVVVAPYVDKVSWVYGLYASAATILGMVIIYMLFAQILGPNVSMTQYSYSVDGPRLAWPGLLTREFLQVSEQRWVAARTAEKAKSGSKAMAPEVIDEKVVPTVPTASGAGAAPAAVPEDLLGAEGEFSDEILNKENENPTTQE